MVPAKRVIKHAIGALETSPVRVSMGHENIIPPRANSDKEGVVAETVPAIVPRANMTPYDKGTRLRGAKAAQRKIQRAKSSRTLEAMHRSIMIFARAAPPKWWRPKADRGRSSLQIKISHNGGRIRQQGGNRTHQGVMPRAIQSGRAILPQLEEGVSEEDDEESRSESRSETEQVRVS